MQHDALSYETLLDSETQKYHAFINLAMLLAMLTSVEIVLIFLPCGFGVLATILIGLSIVKFFCVILWFMHLIYDSPMLFMIFMAGIILAVGTAAALMFLLERHDLDPELYGPEVSQEFTI